MKKHISKSLAAVLLSLFGLSSNIAGMESGGGDKRPRPKVIKHYNVEHTSTETSGQAISYKGPLNILVIGGFNGEFEAKQLTALLCHNEFGLQVSQIEKMYGVEQYREGKVYELYRQPNIRVTYFDVENFNDENYMKKYNLDFIAKNTNIVLYVFGETPDCFERLTKFYHTFNYWWCKGYYNYKNSYKPHGESRDSWFRPVLKAMGAENVRHRYIYFLYYGTSAERGKFLNCKCDDKSLKSHPDCKHAISYFVAAMPDSRSIVGDLFHENSNINALRDYIFNDKEAFQNTKKFNNDDMVGTWHIRDNTEGTGFESQNFQLEKSWEFP